MILKRIKLDVGTITGENCYIVQDETTKDMGGLSLDHRTIIFNTWTF